MNLKNKKELAKKVLGVGKNRIIFSPEGLSEIKEAITKQDIKTLAEEGIITIKPVRGRKTIVKRRTRRGPGKIRRTIKNRKQVYVKLTRKLRTHIKILRNEGKINRELYKNLRKKIKMRYFKDKAHLKDYLKNEIKTKEATIKTEKKKVSSVSKKTENLKIAKSVKKTKEKKQ